jgi:hypothetical protein
MKLNSMLYFELKEINLQRISMSIHQKMADE